MKKLLGCSINSQGVNGVNGVKLEHATTHTVHRSRCGQSTGCVRLTACCSSFASEASLVHGFCQAGLISGCRLHAAGASEHDMQTILHMDDVQCKTLSVSDMQKPQIKHDRKIKDCPVFCGFGQHEAIHICAAGSLIASVNSMPDASTGHKL